MQSHHSAITPSPPPAPSAGRRRIWAGPSSFSCPRVNHQTTPRPRTSASPPLGPAPAFSETNRFTFTGPGTRRQGKRPRTFSPTTPAGPLRARRRPATPPHSRAPCSRAPLETSPRPKHLLPTRATRREPPRTPASRPAPVPKAPAPPRCLSFSYPGVNRQTLRPLLTSATHPCPARAPGESSTCPRSPAPPSSPLHPAPGPSPGAKSSRPPAHCRHPAAGGEQHLLALTGPLPEPPRPFLIARLSLTLRVNHQPRVASLLFLLPDRATAGPRASPALTGPGTTLQAPPAPPPPPAGERTPTRRPVISPYPAGPLPFRFLLPPSVRRPAPSPPAALARDDPTPAGPSPGAKSSRPPRTPAALAALLRR